MSKDQAMDKRKKSAFTENEVNILLAKVEIKDEPRAKPKARAAHKC